MNAASQIAPLLASLLKSAALYADFLLFPTMATLFLWGIVARWVLFLTLKCEAEFAKEFERRVYRHLAERSPADNSSFAQVLKKLLENTFREAFDQSGKISHKLFLVREGTGRMVRDTLNRTTHIRKSEHPPSFSSLSRLIFEANPVFTRVFGVVPVNVCNDIVQILPGILVCLGLLGMLLGIGKTLPTLATLDFSQVEVTKKVFDKYFLSLMGALGIAALGISMAIALLLVNAFFSLEVLFTNMVTKFAVCLECIWNDSSRAEVVIRAVPTTGKHNVPPPPEKEAAPPPPTTPSVAPATAVTPTRPVMRAPTPPPPPPPPPPSIPPAPEPVAPPPVDNEPPPPTIPSTDEVTVTNFLEEIPPIPAATTPMEEVPPAEEIPAEPVLHSEQDLLSKVNEALAKVRLDAPEMLLAEPTDPEMVELKQQLDALDREMWKYSDEKTRATLSESQWENLRMKWQAERSRIQARMQALREEKGDAA